MSNAYVISALRTPIVRAGREFSRIGADKLLAAVIDELLTRSGVNPRRVDHVFAGNAAGPGGNIARVAALASSLPQSIPATSIDAQCASALEAIAAGARMIRSNEADIVISGGVESVSTAPWRMEKNSDPMKLPCVYSRARFTPAPSPDPDMGVAAENIAAKFSISRERQDAFSLRSHQRAVSAAAAGKFSQEIIKLGSGTSQVDKDSCPRSNLSMEKLSVLRPAFVPDGSVTAGNSCPINDGAAAVLLVSESVLNELNPEFSLKYLGAGSGASDPELLGMAAVPAFERLIARLSEQAAPHADSLIEFNEAFAAQALACLDELGIPEKQVNKDGGALALGHPYGASGAVLVTRLFWQAAAKKQDRQLAYALMAAAGGTGSALAFESQLRTKD